MGGRLINEGTEVYLQLTDVDVWQRSKQHCKAIILQLKIRKFRGKNVTFFKATQHNWGEWITGIGLSESK